MATINKIKVGDATYDLQSNLSVTTSGSGSMVSNVAYNTATKGLTVTKSNPQEAYMTFGGPNKAGDITPVDLATMENFSANRLALAKPAGITVEYSNDGGTTWADYEATDSQKVNLVSSGSVTLYLGKRTTANTGIDADRLRITLNATNMGLYTSAKKLYINFSSQGLNNCKCYIETSNKGSETTWTKFGEYTVAGWPGWNSIPLGFNFGGSAGQTSNRANIRLTFYGTHSTSGNYTKCIAQVLNLALAGATYWATPSNLAKTGHMYTWDSSKNTIFNEGGVSIGKSSGPASSYKLDVNGAINGTSVYSNGKQVIDTVKMQGSSTALAVSSGTVVIPTVAGEKGADGISIGTITATATSVASNVAPSVTVSQVTSGNNKNITMDFKLPKGATGPSGVVSVVTAGSGNAVTSGSYDSATKTVTLTKGSTFLTSSSLGNYLPLSGGTMTGPIVQGFNDSLIVDSENNGWFDMNNGFDLYTTSGTEFAWLDGGNGRLELYNEKNIISIDTSHPEISASTGTTDVSFILNPTELQLNNDTTRVLIDATPSPEILLATNSGQNYITMQGQYLAFKLCGNELCLGNNASTSTTNLNINYHSIAGCGTYAGFILRAGSDTSLATLQCGAVTAPAFYQTSDIRKKDIKEGISLDKCYDLIDKCQTIIYSLKDQTKEQVGMIAQEVEEFFPEVIQTDEEGFKSLDYSRLVVICFKVLKDLIKRVSKLEEK